MMKGFVLKHHNLYFCVCFFQSMCILAMTITMGKDMAG